MPPTRWTPARRGSVSGPARLTGRSPSSTTGARGTAVRLHLTNPLSPLLDAGYVEEALRRHFQPLLDPAFDDLLRRHYASGIVFEIDGRPVARTAAPVRERVVVPIRLGRRRLPSAVAVLERHPIPLNDDRQGIAVSTYGKVIRRGWDWLGLTPAAPSRVSGLIEAPDLAACLTLSKNDFIRTGSRGAAYLAYRKAIQEVVSRQLSAWGDARESDAHRRTARLERDLERVLEDLADDFPLLRSLVDRRAGGQKRLPLPGRGHEQVPGRLFADVAAEDHAGGDAAPSDEGGQPVEEVSPGEEAPPPAAPPPSGRDPVAPAPTPNGSRAGGDASAVVGTLATVPGRRRPGRYGLLVQFESRVGDPELGRLVDSTIWINAAHPAYGRASASRSTGYHTALTVALALAPLAVGPADEHGFITRFLSEWGGASGEKRPRSAKSRRRKR